MNKLIKYEISNVKSAENYERIFKILGDDKIDSISVILSEYYGITSTLIFDEADKHFQEKDLKYSFVEGRFFTEDEICDGENVVIVSNQYIYEESSDLKVDDYMLIGNIKYRVVGIYRSIESGIAVPYRSVRDKEGLIFGSIFVNVNSKISPKEKNELISQMPDIEISQANKGEINYQIIYSLLYAGMILIVLLLCIINVIHLMKVYEENNKRKIEIYKSQGASNKQCRVIKVAFELCGILCSLLISVPTYLFAKGVIDAFI